jgi:flagellar hook-associated protein 3 FlgL
VFSFLADVAQHLRGDWTQLSGDLAEVDTHLRRVWDARSVVGARYAQLETMRDRTDQDLLLLRERLSGIEDIDLPATIVDLQLQEMAYQAALSATARSVQPSLLDFLR